MDCAKGSIFFPLKSPHFSTLYPGSRSLAKLGRCLGCSESEGPGSCFSSAASMAVLVVHGAQAADASIPPGSRDSKLSRSGAGSRLCSSSMPVLMSAGLV